jgi:acylphosphatase
VGFRYTAQNVALQYNVSGYVRNLADGRVELVVEGPAEEMERFVEALGQRMNGYIQGTERKVGPATGEFRRFSIRH